MTKITKQIIQLIYNADYQYFSKNISKKTKIKNMISKKILF